MGVTFRTGLGFGVGVGVGLGDKRGLVPVELLGAALALALALARSLAAGLAVELRDGEALATATYECWNDGVDPVLITKANSVATAANMRARATKVPIARTARRSPVGWPANLGPIVGRSPE